MLAKPVAIVGLVPVAAMLIERYGFAGALRRPQNWAFFALALVPYLAYDRYVASIAEWHWASGITRLHVLPGLRGAFASFAAFRHKLGLFRDALGMLAKTMLGWPGLALFVSSIFVPVRTRSRALLYAWLAAALLYAYVVVTVERVDYYLYVFLPLAALWSGGLVSRAAEFLPETRPARISAVALGALAVLGMIVVNRSAVRAYYRYNPAVYRAAKALDATLEPDALVVMGHYDPSILYYIDRKGWEEDPYIWTPFDEESAIGKGARYFIAIENRRLKRNVELSAWLERFPVANPNAKWPVYETDYAKELPGAEARWQAFRRRERSAGEAKGPGLR